MEILKEGMPKAFDKRVGPIPVNTATPAPIATNNADDIITTLLFFSL